MKLKRETVELENYNSQWKKLYEKERKILQRVLGDRIIDIEHVGSTAIPGIKAKPIIDIAVAVNKLSDFLGFCEILENNNYDIRYDNGEKGEYFVSKSIEKNETYYIHFVEVNSERWNHLIVFRDYLISHPDKALEYQRLKENLAKKFCNDRKKYTQAKSAFIKGILSFEDKTN